MADLYGTAPSPAPEQEEISTFLQQLLHNSSSTSSSSSSKFMHHVLSSPPPPPQPLSSAGIKFSDPGDYFSKPENAAVSKRVVGGPPAAESDPGYFSGDSEGAKGCEIPSDSVRPRSSSKRSRAAEVHNLSEKRRRSRINEKMKALQNLIPNSNKTDKASMLDEAIEYLKQLQLQVQMLTMRNGLSLHPMCLPGVLNPMQLPLTGMSFDEGNGLLNTNTVTGAFSVTGESSVQTGLNLPDQRAISNQPIAMPSGTRIPSSEATYGFEPLIQVHYGPFNLTASSKDICREAAPQAQLDTNQTVKTSSSGVS